MYIWFKKGTINRIHTIRCSQVLYLYQSKNDIEGTRQIMSVTSGKRQPFWYNKKEGSDCFLKTQDFEKILNDKI